MLLFLYILFIANGTLGTIEHNLFVSRHSYSASDRDFATIKKRVKRCKICNIGDVKCAIRSSRLDRPFKVIETGKKIFFYFAGLKETKDSPGIVYFN